MPYPEKSRQKHTFTDGMNSDLAREIFPNTMARYILNCHIRSTNDGSEGIVTNPKGNLMITTPLPAGNNKCIGTMVAIERNKFYFFVYNDQGKHSILEYDEVSNVITKILENLTHTGGIDILRFSKDWLILHADYIDGKGYWVDGLNAARKTNFARLLDKSQSGYGPVVLESFIDAYMRTSIYAPTAKYASDLTKPYNRFYGHITKYAQRYGYMDSELSPVSDWSAAITPEKEPTQGINNIPTDNNAIDITVETGSHDVKEIQILMQSTIADIDDVSGTLNWKLIVTLNKKKLKIADNVTYTYRFYNDGDFATVAASDVIQAQSFMMDRPLCQSLAKGVMTYSNGYVGFPVVDIDASISIIYGDLFIDTSVDNKFNDPAFVYGPTEANYVGSGVVTRYDGSIRAITTFDGPIRFQRQTLTIGFDVKKGNKFVFSDWNGYAPDDLTLTYIANVTDTAATVANAIKNLLIATGRIYRQTPGIADTNIYNNSVDGGGNVTFAFIIASSKGKPYMNGATFVDPVQYNTLKDTGVSVKAEKMGTRKKLYYEYIKFNGQKSAAFSDDNLIEIVQSENVAGKKSVTIRLTTNHLPPIEAEYFQILRSKDLNTVDFIQLLVQKVVDVPTDNTSQYLDLVIGSFATYKKLHPNSTLTFDFGKGDRVSLKKKTSTDTYYPFFETEVLEYNEIVEDRVKDSLVTDGTAVVKVTSASASNIGKFISIEGGEREIVGATADTYTLNNVIGEISADKTYLYYDLIDRRGTLRIRKPSPSVVVIEDESIIEVYKPSRSSETDETAFEFQQKFQIINAGTANAYHSGNIQNQSASQPSIIDIGAGSIYVRNREMPINNSFPGTQVLIALIEDPSYSDFYSSRMNDNGRVNSLDKGQGVVHVADRVQFSMNYLEGNLINGLNNFKNLNRRDYSDDYGDIKLTRYENERLIIYKELRTRWVPLNAVLTQQTTGTSLLVASDNFLNDIYSYAWEGGLGNNPESWASNGTHKYYASANSGVIIRFGGNGEEPISDTFHLDSEARQLLADAARNKSSIYGVFDREYGYYVLAFEGFDKYIFFDGFSAWVTFTEPLADDVVFEVVTSPSHGTFDIVTRTYTPTTDYVGSDTFSYRAFLDGVWTEPRNICLTIVEGGSDLTAWRGKGLGTCVLDGDGLRTGYNEWETLEQFNIFTLVSTGTEKPNDISDPDYIAPVFDDTKCSVEFGNDYQSETFYSEACPDGEEPDPYLYEVQPNEFKAATKEEANALALADIAANGQETADEEGTCTAHTYVWGKIFEEEPEVSGGATYAKLVLRTFVGGTSTTPPPDTSLPYVCTNPSIPVAYYEDAYGTNNNFNVSMSAELSKLLIPPGVSSPIYPKMMVYCADCGIEGGELNLWGHFQGKAENEWALLQTI